MDVGGEFLYPKSQQDLLSATELNPTPTTVPPPMAAMAGNIGERHVLVFLGLPLVGKRTIALRLKRYLRFFHGAKCRGFDISALDGGSNLMSPLDANTHSSEFFNKLRKFLDCSDTEFHQGEDGKTTGGGVGSSPRQNRTSVNGIDPMDKNAKNVDSGRVAIVFSSNAMSSFYENWSGSSKERRRWILAQLATISNSSKSKTRIKTIFIEVTLTKKYLEREILSQKLERDVREGRLEPNSTREAGQEWREKVQEYKKLYVTLQDDGSEDDLSYMKLINYGERVLTNRMRAYLPQRIVQFLTATHPTKHTIYLCRHGQSEYNTTGRLGGNSPLTEQGWVFAEILSRFAAQHVCKLKEFHSGQGDGDIEEQVGAGGWMERGADDEEGPSVAARLWTSSLFRTIQTAALIPHPVIRGPDGSAWESMSPRVYRNIDEIFAGDCEGLTPEEVKVSHPQASNLRKMDKIGYRYPRGESYFDIISRLEPCIQEMESYTEPLLIVSHQAILRCIFAYLTGVDREKAPGMETQIQQNVVYQIDLDASSEDHITGVANNLPAFVTVHDFRKEVEETMLARTCRQLQSLDPQP
uniref:6-phosphofructo-2-kinase domain-containing protein n=1 Tax=Mantoniella antarctica TaxID=81844 RepID=A0A7S0SPL5_9CHLO